jgi:hypothetical protein
MLAPIRIATTSSTVPIATAKNFNNFFRAVIFMLYIIPKTVLDEPDPGGKTIKRKL